MCASSNTTAVPSDPGRAIAGRYTDSSGGYKSVVLGRAVPTQPTPSPSSQIIADIIIRAIYVGSSTSLDTIPRLQSSIRTGLYYQPAIKHRPSVFFVLQQSLELILHTASGWTRYISPRRLSKDVCVMVSSTTRIEASTSFASRDVTNIQRAIGASIPSPGVMAASWCQAQREIERPGYHRSN